MLELVVAASDGTPKRQLNSFDFDCAFGSDENDFTVRADYKYAPEAGDLVFFDNTEYGGIVDSVKTLINGNRREIVARGRSWHGVLASKIVMPPSDSSNLVLQGSAGDCIQSVIDRMQMSSLFLCVRNATAVTYEFPRFCNAYFAITEMLKSSGLLLSMRYIENKVALEVRKARTILSEIDSDVCDFEIERVNVCVNHLICAGEGEGVNRTILHLFADKSGNISKTQTLFGNDEITEFYNYTSADAATLEEGGRRRLFELQRKGAISISINNDIGACVGDMVEAFDHKTNTHISAEVVRKTVRITDGFPSYTYEVGKGAKTQSGNATGSPEKFTSGGRVYNAGEGLRLDGSTFIAEVSEAKLNEGLNPLKASITDMREQIERAKREAFLTAYPVGFICYTDRINPERIGGKWKQMPSLGAHCWKRIS